MGGRKRKQFDKNHRRSRKPLISRHFSRKRGIVPRPAIYLLHPVPAKTYAGSGWLLGYLEEVVVVIRRTSIGLAACVALAACGVEESSPQGPVGTVSTPGAGMQTDAPGAPGEGAPMSSGDPAPQPSGGQPPGAQPPGDQPPPAAPTDPATPPGGAGAAAPPTGDNGPAMIPMGPVDGDPAAPVVEIPGIACGGVVNPLAIAAANHTIGGREVIVDYPCGKNEGAHVTFILNLHGTMPEESLKFYQHANFSAYRLATSHNLVQVAPKTKAASGQWGNGDGGVDEPHLLEVVDWVYETFSQFQIVSMWVVGHSWGSGYASRFVCHDHFADRATGVVLMSGPSPVACSDRVSVIGSTGEVDTGNPNLEGAASSHGCGPRMDLANVGETQIEAWPCPAGAAGKPDFVFRNYTWLGRGHQVAPGDWAHEAGVDDLVNAIKSIE